MSKSPSGPAAAVLAPAEVIAGRYRIVSVLVPPSAETVGTTYSVVDLTTGAAPLSSQSPRPELTLRLLADPGSSGGSLGDEERERLAQQAAHLGALRHPAVARTYELGLVAELGVFLAREPVESEGQSLRDVLARRGGPLPEDEAILLCAQIGEALEAAHLQGICHLGLSPSCIYIYPDGSGVRLKVADFGLLPPAWAARVGAAGYLAPEQVDGQLGGYVCDRRTDQFALAVILYEMLAGQPAFVAAADEDRRVILGRIRNEDPLPLAQSRGVEQALARALSRSRAVRFPAVRDFMRALGADVSGWPTGSGLPVTSGAPGGGRAPRVLVPMAVGALCALLGLGGVVALQRFLQLPIGRVALADLSTFGRARSDMDAPPADAATASLAPAAAGAGEGGAEPGDADFITDDGGSRDLLPAAPDLRRRPGISNLEPSRNNPPNKPGTDTKSTGSPGTPGTLAPPLPQALPTLQFGGDAVSELGEEQRAQITRCVKMILPQPPFEIYLQYFNDTLYVDPDRSSAQFSGSQDFRDCLKLGVKGKIVPKVITITTRMPKKVAP